VHPNAPPRNNGSALKEKKILYWLPDAGRGFKYAGKHQVIAKPEAACRIQSLDLITHSRDRSHGYVRQFGMRIMQKERAVPVLLIALLALAVFGIIGVLLLTAAVLETKTENKQNRSRSPARNCHRWRETYDWLAVRRSARSHALEQRAKNRKNGESVSETCKPTPGAGPQARSSVTRSQQGV